MGLESILPSLSSWLASAYYPVDLVSLYASSFMERFCPPSRPRLCITFNVTVEWWLGTFNALSMWEASRHLPPSFGLGCHVASRLALHEANCAISYSVVKGIRGSHAGGLRCVPVRCGGTESTQVDLVILIAPISIHHSSTFSFKFSTSVMEELNNSGAKDVLLSTLSGSPSSGFSSNDSLLEIEQNDLSWLTERALVHRGHIVLSESEEETKNVEAKVGSGLPIKMEVYDKVIVGTFSPIPPKPVNYELKDILSCISKEEVDWFRQLYVILNSIFFKRPERREGPLDGKTGEITMHTTSLESS
ncbi:hypothetical protein FNV43_RR00634 [Rhamnella rubrinervis]|uniref:Uncharacterized protein n=1 Tax=Rhamnella rubrinervis TaxID=2594499 RepID=A0A8K0MRC5_9ROSA|nr:hypothetical protein FNV43_RR00634 [Rhamnella rubrinervis]